MTSTGSDAELRLWSQAVAATEEAMLVLDRLEAGGVVRLVSPAFVRITGYRAAEVEGQRWGFLEGEGTETRAAGRLRAAIRAGQPVRTDLRFLRRDGSPFWASVSTAPIHDPDSPDRAVVVFREVTAERAMRAEAERSRRLSALGQMAGGMAHDVRNLLTGISMLAELWNDDPRVPDELRSDLGEIRELVARGGSLTSQLLEFASQPMVSPEPLDLAAEAARIHGFLDRTLRDDVTLTIRLPPDPVWILAGPGQVHQVLVNLCLNAQDAMPEGGSITVGVMRDPEQTGVELRVRDTGVGIPPEARDRVFEPFFTTRGDRGGTGLGLASVYGIVQQWGGRIGFDSEVGLGTTFTISIPLIEPPEQVSVASASQDPGRPLRVLLAEDDPTVRRALRRVFEAQGWTVAEAGSGRTASEIWDRRETPFDVVVSDVLMPDGNGADLYRHLRATDADVPIVFVSGYAPRTLRGMERILAPAPSSDPNVHFVAKPFALPELIRQVATAVARR